MYMGVYAYGCIHAWRLGIYIYAHIILYVRVVCLHWEWCVCIGIWRDVYVLSD